MNEEEMKYYLELLKEAKNETEVKEVIKKIWEDAQDDLMGKENKPNS